MTTRWRKLGIRATAGTGGRGGAGCGGVQFRAVLRGLGRHGRRRGSYQPR